MTHADKSSPPPSTAVAIKSLRFAIMARTLPGPGPRFNRLVAHADSRAAARSRRGSSARRERDTAFFGIIPHRMSESSAPRLLVAIDGPAGAGKTSVARTVARELGLPMLDTGAIYRSLALAARRAGVEWTDAVGLAKLADGFPISFAPGEGERPQQVLLRGEDVSAEIRTAAISDGASRVSAHPEVRAALLEIQRALGAEGCVAEGRDMGTVVFPHADFKFFLTATAQARAERRHRDLVAAEGDPVPDLAEVKARMHERDTRDSSRTVSPLRQAPDAVCVDSSKMPLAAVIDRILGTIRATGER